MSTIQHNTPVEHFYNSRENFTVIGLTGLAGSGCSTLAKLMTNEEFWLDEQNVRKPEDIPFSCTTKVTNVYSEEERDNIEAVSQLVFKRKYTICYDFIKNQYKPYRLIKYTRVILLYTFLYAIEKMDVKDADDLKETIKSMMEDKFYPSKSPTRDIEFKKCMGYDSETIDVTDVLGQLDWKDLWEALTSISSNQYISVLHNDGKAPDSCKLAEFFFDNEKFNMFVDSYILSLSKKDYYSLCFMFHRLTACIRNWGNPFKLSQQNYDELNNRYDHLYDVVKLINYIIKGEQRNKGENDSSRRIVIDSIRNSMEALFFKERYTAFYLIAVHDDEHRVEHFKDKVRLSVAGTLIEQKKSVNKEKIETMYRSLMYLMNLETANSDFEKGKFHSPNIGQCIADAEIHISNVPDIQSNAKAFYTMAEQWMKYAALILHPGLITPSSEERCMIVAYTAKFNSGCLSRQVGACITNQYHSIRTIGWNDVPYGQIPCSLRELGDVKSTSNVSRSYFPFMYSDFEQGKERIYDDHQYTFKEKVDDDFRDISVLKDSLKGLPLSYCFKTLQNRYEGEKNQVYTRSLHAEENAMMQMVKYGGEALINGIIYVTASPCELCSKKLYQIGVRKIVYIDPYPGISRKQIIACGFKRPALKLFQGAYGSTYFKLYQPFMSYKDEITLRTGNRHEYKTKDQLLQRLLMHKSLSYKSTYTQEEFDRIIQAFECNCNIQDDKD